MELLISVVLFSVLEPNLFKLESSLLYIISTKLNLIETTVNNAIIADYAWFPWKASHSEIFPLLVSYPYDLHPLTPIALTHLIQEASSKLFSLNEMPFLHLLSSFFFFLLSYLLHCTFFKNEDSEDDVCLHFCRAFIQYTEVTTNVGVGIFLS